VRERAFAVCGWADEVLCNPPGFVPELAIEAPDFFPPTLAMVGLNSQNILAEPGQKFGVNFRANILSAWVFAGCLKFFFEFDMPVRIEFEKETPAVF
jgi:hypothetical protein